jgi:hypothetical protein
MSTGLVEHVKRDLVVLTLFGHPHQKLHCGELIFRTTFDSGASGFTEEFRELFEPTSELYEPLVVRSPHQ